MMYYIDADAARVVTARAEGAAAQTRVDRRAFLQWVCLGHDAMGGPFLHDHINRIDRALCGLGGAPRALQPHTTSLDMVADAAKDALVSVRGIVFHTSRCGSTLLANALRNAGHSVVSEPEVWHE